MSNGIKVVKRDGEVEPLNLDKIHISNKLQQKKSYAWLSKDGMHKHFSQSAIPQWPWCVANPEYNANDPDYSLAYSLCFVTSKHAHDQHLQTSAMHMQNQIHKDIINLNLVKNFIGYFPDKNLFKKCDSDLYIIQSFQIFFVY